MRMSCRRRMGWERIRGLPERFIGRSSWKISSTAIWSKITRSTDTVCSARKTIRIAGDDYPAEVVKSRFMKLDSSHIEYVLSSMQENTTYVRNIKKYLLAALYNAPSTISSYYTSLVNHDLYGGGERR